MASGPKRGSVRPKRKPEELRKAARHVTYEVEMLFFSAEDLGGWHASPMASPEDAAKNMALECFLLHFRNLRSFLCPGSEAWKDDIVASDFLDAEKLTDVGDKAVLWTDKVRLDKMLAHLSYTRENFIEAQNYGWSTAQMELVLLDQLGVFLGLLSPERRAWFPPTDQLAKGRQRAEDDKLAVRRYETTTSFVSFSGPGPVIGGATK